MNDLIEQIADAYMAQGWFASDDRQSAVELAEVAVRVAEPIIRADERKRIEKFAIPAWREEIALDIEALMPEPKDHCIEEYNAGLTNAARIARGGTP